MPPSLEPGGSRALLIIRGTKNTLGSPIPVKCSMSPGELLAETKQMVQQRLGVLTRGGSYDLQE